ncbi:MAG TPA: hypothetical protein VI794_00805 [Patescibacteria group bacterium]|nr:hypothetical protein [Patescibacteria group bacterium]
MEREVMSILISGNWVHQEPEALEHLAEYLYSFFHFLFLDYPGARVGWSISTSIRSGRRYLVIWESWEDQDPEKREGEPEPESPPEDFGVRPPTKGKDLSKPDPLTTLTNDEEDENGDEPN